MKIRQESHAARLANDARFALRRLRRAPSFAVATVVVLALGVGATTAVFSLVNAILLEPLPFPEPSRLVRMMHTVSDVGPTTVDQSDASVMLYQSQVRAFDGIAAWRFDDGDLGASEPGQNAVRVRGARVTANFFDVLRVRPALGRGFESGEDRPGAQRVVVLSYRIWQERFHGDAGALGRQIVVNDVRRTIVGVMPPRFAYPARRVELWLPVALDPAHTRPATFDLMGIGRLGRGVSAEAARSDLARVLHGINDYTATWQQAHVTPQVQPLRDSIVGPVSHLLWLLFASVLLVLLVACTNVAGLFLVRAESMRLELAVRSALGSGRWGVIVLSLSESVLLSAVGGGVGVLLARLAITLATSADGALSLPRSNEVGISAPVVLFAVGMTAFCAIAVSVLPLLRTHHVPIAQVLRGTGPGPIAGRSRQRARDALVVAQIALAFVLVASSGLMTRSFLRLNDVRPGFDADDVVTSRVLLPYARYGGAATRLNFFETLIQRTKAVPGVQAVATTEWVPLSGDHHDMAIDVDDDSRRPNTGGASHAVAAVDGQYFQTLRIPLLRGRTFGAQDPARPSDEAVVSHAFAERYWPGASPLGKRVRPLGGRWYTVIGEVGDVHYDALETPANDILYFPIVAAQPDASASLPAALSLIVRTDGRDREVLSAIRDIVHSIDAAVPTYDEGSLRELVRAASSRSRALVVLLAFASALTSLLAAVGLYGVMAYGVSVRRRELAVRIALGARPVDVGRMVSMNGLRLAGTGIMIGLVCALATSRLLRGFLYGVSPTDLVTLIVTPATLLLVAFVASWLPARRAAAVHPAEALRSQ